MKKLQIFLYILFKNNTKCFDDDLESRLKIILIRSKKRCF